VCSILLATSFVALSSVELQEIRYTDMAAYGSKKGRQALAESILQGFGGESIQDQIDAELGTAKSATTGTGATMAEDMLGDTESTISDMKQRSLGARMKEKKEVAEVKKDKGASFARDWMALLMGHEEKFKDENFQYLSDKIAAESSAPLSEVDADEVFLRTGKLPEDEAEAEVVLASSEYQSTIPMEDRIFAPEEEGVSTGNGLMSPNINKISEGLPYYAGSTTSTDDADILRESQERLSSTGHYRTTVDGIGGRSTTNAIKTFQFENGLTVTGELNQQTRNKLASTGLEARPEIADANNELLSFIGKGESGGYGAANDYGNGRTQWGVMDSYFSEDKGKPLDKLTVSEIRDIQSGGFGTREVFAVGAYQLIPSTFEAAVEALDIPDDAVFDRELQDRIALEYLAADKRPKLRDWMEGDQGVTRDEAMMALAKEWASIPVPYDITRKGMRIRRGESYYKPEGNTANAHTAEETEALLDRLRPSNNTENN